jgi:hypothetical protein
VDLKRGKLQEMIRKYGKLSKLTSNQKKSNLVPKHTFVALNLVIYCTFYASMLSSF